jgi:hypothetical protein
MATLEAEHIVKKVLGADAAFIAIVGTALIPMNAIQGQAFPFTVYERETTDITHDMSGASGINRADMTLRHYADDPQTALNMAERARLVLGAVTGTVTVGADTVEVDYGLLQDQSMEYTTPTDGSEGGVYFVRQRFDIAYTVST